MNKSELVSALSEETKQPKTVVEAILDGFQAVTRKTLKKGGEVNLIGFGKFSVSKRAARKGINPQTGVAIQIAARKAIKFTAGSALKNAVN